MKLYSKDVYDRFLSIKIRGHLLFHMNDMMLKVFYLPRFGKSVRIPPVIIVKLNTMKIALTEIYDFGIA